jgi:adenine-specific DNA-methyltransferase
MATIETLITQIDDPALRDKLAREVAEMKKRLDWGLVFERHLPENVRALSAPIKPGSVVWERRSATPRRFRVRSIDGADLLVVVEPEKTTAPTDAPTERIARSEVLVEQDFAEPIFPVPTPIGAVRNGPADAPYHAVMQGENYHTIQALLAAYDRSFDLIYLDPPYNTGNKDWSYNNDYVDPNDTYRPSRWLAFMERRLRVARRLLKSDGVIVVTIDENEVHRLGMLLEQLFPEALTQMVTIAINPHGTSGEGLSRVDEYAYFVFFGGTQPNQTFEDFFGPEGKTRARWWTEFIRGSHQWTRAARPNLCYPIMIDVAGRIAGAGDPLQGPDEERPLRQGDCDLAWPVRADGRLGIWKLSAARVREMYAQGYIVATKPARGTWSIRYLLEGALLAIESGELEVAGYDRYGGVILPPKRGRVVPKTMWHRVRHTAGAAGGTAMLAALFGRTGVFSFPKSIYSVRDTIDAAIGSRKDALILDFFAGSGTTLHATLMLNAGDGGRRRCVLVTNNELPFQTAQALEREGRFRGDPEFESAGVFETATRPRVTAAITGVRADGLPVEGEYLDGRSYAEGFAENVEFYRLDYLDPAEVEFGLRYGAIEPLLWLRAGGIGERAPLDPTAPLGLPAHSPYAVLFDPAGLPDLLAVLPERTDITHVFIVADSPESFAQIVADLPHHIEKVRLYRDYLETLRGATR